MQTNWCVLGLSCFKCSGSDLKILLQPTEDIKMSQNGEPITQTNPNINTIYEIPKKPFRVTMEFPMFFVMLSVSLAGVAVSNILLYRICWHSLNHTQAECKIFLSPVKSNTSQQLEDEVQKYATVVTMVKTVIESVAPAVLSLFLGVWSDTHGRKPLVTWPLLGISSTAGLLVIYSMMEHLGPWWYIITLIPFSLTGGFTVLFTGVFCYLSDITSTEQRSIRMTLLEAGVSAGSVIGSLLSSYVLKAVGNIYLLLISTTLSVIAYIFTVFLDESLPGSVEGGFSKVFELGHVKEMFKTCLKKRPNRGRAQIILLSFANSLSIFILYGLMGLEYLYVRYKLHWALKQYSTFSAVSTSIFFFGSIFGVMVVQRLLRVSDLAFATIAFISVTLEYLIKTFAVTTWHMYLSVAISLFRGLSSPLIRSLITKILPAEDIAKVFALMCAIEGVCPLISPVLYNSLYAFTLSTFPGAIYVLSSSITGFCAVCLGVVQYYRWKTPSIIYENLESEESASS